MNKSGNSELLIVTGLSGAGISSTLKHLEDLGYEVFDNFPPALIDPLLTGDGATAGKPVAIGIDTRARGFAPELIADLVGRHKAKLIFVTADETVLQRRFTETRRKHPLATDRPVTAGIRKEIEWLYGLKKQADRIIDTSELSIHDLRRQLEGHFALGNQSQLTLTLMSFGFRYGVPREADIVMDIRFLKNPHWDPVLKPQTGKDKDVGAYIEEDPHFGDFVSRFRALLEPTLPLYHKEGKHYLTVAIGCTGGRHRSVYTVEKLGMVLAKPELTLNLIHRDLDRKTG